MARRDFEVVDQQVSKGTQDVTIRLLTKLRLVTGEGRGKDLVYKVRFEVKSDAYKAQCYAKAEVWSPTDLRWNEVVRLRGEEMATEHGMHHKPFSLGTDPKAFDADLDRLAKMAEIILA